MLGFTQLKRRTYKRHASICFIVKLFRFYHLYHLPSFLPCITLREVGQLFFGWWVWAFSTFCARPLMFFQYLICLIGSSMYNIFQQIVRSWMPQIFVTMASHSDKPRQAKPFGPYPTLSIGVM